MSESTQFGGTAGKEVCDVVVGFDFGTSCSKVVLRSPYHYGPAPNGRAFATPFGNLGHKSCSYLLPSVLWVTKGGEMSLGQMNGALLLRDIKYHLMRNQLVPAVNARADGERYDAKVVALGFLALALREARRWFISTHGALYGQYDLRWTFNIGLPSADFADKELCLTYHKVAKAAWMLSLQTGKLHLLTASGLLDSPARWDGLDDRDTAEIKEIPEVAAEVAGYARSTERPEGLHILVDVGATTLDVCSFNLHELEGDDCYALFTADVQRLGASMLYHQRVAAVRHAVDDHVKALWDEYDPVSAMAESAAAYSPHPNSISESINHHDREYSGACSRMIWKTLVDLKTRRVPRSPRWQSVMPLFLSGGGSVMQFYRSFIESVSTRLKGFYHPCEGIRVLSLPKPENLEAEVNENTYHRLAVAWGLSYPQTDIGQVVRPSEIEDGPPSMPYDWGDKEFISKDMV